MYARSDRNFRQNSSRLTDHGFVAPTKKHPFCSSNNLDNEFKNGKHQRVPLGQISGITTLSHRNLKNPHKQDDFQIWNEERHDENGHQKNDSQHNMELSQNTEPDKNASIDMSCSQDDSLLFEDAPSAIIKSPHKNKDNRIQEDSESVYMTAQSQFSSNLGSNEAFYSCPEYADDIFKYLRYRETKFRPRLSYMQKQSEITIQMRSILVDWFIDVINEYNLHRSTLFLTVSILDRTLSCLDCPRLKLQLLGASSVMIASKYEEIYPPEVKDMVYITDDSYTKDQIVRMEKIVLRVLDFSLSSPTAQTFASMLISKANLSSQATSLVWYLLELSLMHFDLLIYRPSELAAAAVSLSAFLVDRKRPIHLFFINFGLNLQNLYAPMSDLLRIFHQAPSDSLAAIFSKYSESKYFNVAGMTLPSTVPREFFDK